MPISNTANTRNAPSASATRSIAGTSSSGLTVSNATNAPSAPAPVTRSTVGTSNVLTISNTTNTSSAPATQPTESITNPSKRPIASIVNPCTFLNTYHQVIKTQDPPNYKFSLIKRPKGYVAELNYLGESWKSHPKNNKKESKEEVATLCADSIESKHHFNFLKVLHVLEKFGSQKARIAKDNYLVDTTPEIVKWYNAERMLSSPKSMRVLLLELCQKYSFGHPRFYLKSGPNNHLNYYKCCVDQRSWEPDTGFSKKSDAKNHVATRAFNSLFHEIKSREEEEIKKKIEQMKNLRAKFRMKKEIKYITLLHDAAGKKHWTINYEYQSNNDGIIAHVHVGAKRFSGSPQISKNAAKEDVSRIAYGNFVLNGDF
ncbi:hypothetical protein RclHR1_05560007 [Rhizophagus clarus]|uniref:DRBM domain-containing protein n=1 Tax=Rhizophagus clarus TaxID=94130 RepID=A0A2Z6SFF1_9GLOM|nr:hypothetical protein RclHR1_05560007 [Rhizophagus clarus]